MLAHNKILLFDFETTGLYGNSDEIIEFGAILLERQNGLYKVSKELGMLVKASKKLPAKIVEITNITDYMLETEGVSQEEAFKEFFDLFIDEKTLLVAYNIMFDIQFLIEWIKKFHNRNFELKNDLLDVMAIYKDRHRYPHRLEQAVITYNIEEPNTHRALDDARATLEVLKKMSSEKNNIEKYVNKIGYNPKYPPRIRYAHLEFIPQRGGMREIENS